MRAEPEIVRAVKQLFTMAALRTGGAHGTLSSQRAVARDWGRLDWRPYFFGRSDGIGAAMLYFFIKAAISGLIAAVVSEIARRFPVEDRAQMVGDDGLIRVDCAFCATSFPIHFDEADAA